MNHQIFAFSTIDEYLAQCPLNTRSILASLRTEIKATCPDASEKISWGMPTFVYQGKNLVHFFGHKNHVGFYPGDSAIQAFHDHLTAYRHSKGAIQFSYQSPLPYSLIREIVLFRMAEYEKKSP